ncbi:MAG: hypothetical protein R6X02_04265 [Enhygromyxa sp.]
MHAIKASTLAVLALPLLLALPACGDKKSDKGDKSDESEQAAQPKIEKQELSTLFVGDKVTLPPPFAGLKLGMSAEEGQAALPAMDKGDIKSEEYPEVWFKADFDSESKKLSRVYFNLPKDEAVKLITAQWGEPKQATEYDKEVLWWFNPEAELRASISEAFTEGEAHIEFTHYQPIEKFLGAEGPELAFQKHAPLLGLGREELEAKYGEWLKKEGDDIDLEYPPLEWGKYWTPVHFMWTDDGKIRRVWFSLEFEPHPAAKDEILALLKNKWGEPKEEEEYGKKILVFSEDPFIKVEDDELSKEWDVFIEPKR